MDKTDLHPLIEKLPKNQVPTVGTFIDYFTAQSSPEELSDGAHENALPDDEEYSEEELESFKEGLEELRLDKTISHEEIKRRYNVVVNEADKQASGELLTAKDLDPLTEGRVGRYDSGGPIAD